MGKLTEWFAKNWKQLKVDAKGGNKFVPAHEFYLGNQRWIVIGVSSSKMHLFFDGRLERVMGRKQPKRASSMVNELTGRKSMVNYNHISSLSEVKYNPVTKEVVY